MREIKKKSVVPVYAVAVLWVLYALGFRMYKLIDFIILALLSVAMYMLFSKFFPGKTEYEEVPAPPPEPYSSGNAALDAVVAEGERAIVEMKSLRDRIREHKIRDKVTELIGLLEKIIANLKEDPADLRLVGRFLNYYVPTTIKLLNSYDRMYDQGVSGENISGTMERIDLILDKIILAYEKHLDSLFANEALDIETDISVMEGMLKREGFTNKDF